MHGALLNSMHGAKTRSEPVRTGPIRAEGCQKIFCAKAPRPIVLVKGAVFLFFAAYEYCSRRATSKPGNRERKTSTSSSRPSSPGGDHLRGEQTSPRAELEEILPEHKVSKSQSSTSVGRANLPEPRFTTWPSSVGTEIISLTDHNTEIPQKVLQAVQSIFPDFPKRNVQTQEEICHEDELQEEDVSEEEGMEAVEEEEHSDAEDDMLPNEDGNPRKSDD